MTGSICKCTCRHINRWIIRAEENLGNNKKLEDYCSSEENSFLALKMSWEYFTEEKYAGLFTNALKSLTPEVILRLKEKGRNCKCCARHQKNRDVI